MRGNRNQQDINGITEGVIWKQLLSFFFPIVLGTFFQQLYNTVDAVTVSYTHLDVYKRQGRGVRNF